VSVKDIAGWERQLAASNLAVRLVGPMIGIDVDDYVTADGIEKRGAATIAAAEKDLGPLPATWRSSSRGADSASGIRLYRLPPGVLLGAGAERALVDTYGYHVEIIRPDHRYLIAWPSVHDETGATYRWISPDGTELDEGDIPPMTSVPELPASWVAFFTGAPIPERSSAQASTSSAQASTSSAQASDEDDEFDTPGAVERTFSRAEAASVITRTLDELSRVKRGQINEALNRDAYYLFHFTPVFIDRRDLARRLLEAQRTAWVASGGKDDKDYTKAQSTIRRAAASAAGPGQWVAMEDEDGEDPLVKLSAEAADDDDEDEGAGSTKTTGVFFTDAAFSEHLAEKVLAHRFVHVLRTGWMSWVPSPGGGLWRDADESQVLEAVRTYCLAMFRRAVLKAGRLEGDDDAGAAEREQATALADAWRALCSRSRLSAVTALTAAQDVVSIRIDALDADPDLLNTPSGVVDLRTGQVRPGRPADLMTKITRAPYRGLDYAHPVWEQAIEAIPDDVRDWAQTFMGQAITGHLNTEDRLLLLDGEGKNGKGVLTNDGIAWAIGTYAYLVPETLLMSASQVHPTEFMSLRGVRLALMDETPEARVLDTQRLKRVVGQPQMTARELYQRNVTFDLRHTMVISTNHLPRVTETDHGTWRRLARLRMPYTYRTGTEAIRDEHDRVGDPGIKAALKLDEDVQAAALSWVVRGARAWYAADRRQLDLPPRVATDTDTWRSESDPMWMFVEEFLEFDPSKHVVARELWQHYCSWLESRGHKPWSDQTFADRFASHALVRAHGARVSKARVVAGGPLGAASRSPERFKAGTLETSTRYMAWVGVAYAGDGPADSGSDVFDVP
jgi:P4 family phage/plasmid primase-like protien